MKILAEIFRLHSAAESYNKSIKGLVIYKYFHSERLLPVGSDSSVAPSNLAKKVQSTVGIFWDLDNKPPKSLTPYDAATRLKKAMIEFGFVKYMIAFANQHSFSYVPPDVLAQRRERKVLNHLERKGVVKVDVPYICKVCGRRFHTNEKLTNHFKQIHESEHKKRLNQIESARGKKRVNLIGKYSMKMEKYRNVARDLLTPKVGYGLADELIRAGFWVQTVSDKPQAADIALRNRMVDMMDMKLVDCVVLISDDSDFVGVLREAKERCLRTVVVGDNKDGSLKRIADAAFSWQEIMVGKAKKEAVSVVHRLNDRDILKRLEWTYNPDIERVMCYSDDNSEGSDVEDLFSGEDDDDAMQTEAGRPWWKLDSCTGSENKKPNHIENQLDSNQN